MLTLTESSIDGFVLVGDTVVFVEKRPKAGNRITITVDGPARVERSGMFERRALQAGWRRVEHDAWRHEDGREATTQEVATWLRRAS